MADIAPVLYERIMGTFINLYSIAQSTDGAIKRILLKLENRKATFKDADQYAIEVSSILSKALQDNLILENLPDQVLYYNIADRTFGKSLQEVYGMTSDVAAQVQEDLILASGLHLKAVTANLDTDRLNRLVNYATEARTQEALNNILTYQVENLLMSAVDDTVKANCEFQYKAGLNPVIKRQSTGKCCDWCSTLEGTYKYPDEIPADVFRRHRGCQCTVEYLRADKGSQNVWSKRWSSDRGNRERAERIQRASAMKETNFQRMQKRNDRIEFAANLQKKVTKYAPNLR